MGDRLGTLGAVGITFLVTLPFCHLTLITNTVYEKGGESRLIYLFIYIVGPSLVQEKKMLTLKPSELRLQRPLFDTHLALKVLSV